MREVDPKTTNRAKAFELWMNAAMPMVTMTKTFDITHLRRLAKRKNVKLNMLILMHSIRLLKLKELL